MRERMVSRETFWGIALASLVFAILILSSCTHAKALVGSPEALQYKNDFLEKYRFFVTDLEMEKFRDLPTIEAVDEFVAEFWKIRDIDPKTPENEFKTLIDKRIEDIKNEIFFRDLDTPGLRFASSGGLKGELAHVYLLHGTPDYKAKLEEGRTHVELVTWVYGDPLGRRILYRFLFYRRGGQFHLFRNYFCQMSIECLKEISKWQAVTYQELVEIWEELVRSDYERVFIAALMMFSDFSDVNLHQALKAPEPAATAAKRFKPKFIGQPESALENGEKQKIISSVYHSFVPIWLRIANSSNNRPLISLVAGLKNLDWEIKDDGKLECHLYIRMTFGHQEAGPVAEFSGEIVIRGAEKNIREGIEKTESVFISLDDKPNFAGGATQAKGTLGSLVNELLPGVYILNLEVRNTSTKKYNAWSEKIQVGR